MTELLIAQYSTMPLSFLKLLYKILNKILSKINLLNLFLLLILLNVKFGYINTYSHIGGELHDDHIDMQIALMQMALMSIIYYKLSNINI